MNSSRLWESFKVWIARRFFRLDEIERFVETTDERYLDPQIWARMRGISVPLAAQQLEDGVRLGYLEQCFLYEWPDSPVQFIVPENYLGRTVRLAEIGYIGEDDWREIMISQNRVRRVFIAAGED